MCLGLRCQKLQKFVKFVKAKYCKNADNFAILLENHVYVTTTISNVVITFLMEVYMYDMTVQASVGDGCMDLMSFKAIKN